MSPEQYAQFALNSFNIDQRELDGIDVDLSDCDEYGFSHAHTLLDTVMEYALRGRFTAEEVAGLVRYQDSLRNLLSEWEDKDGSDDRPIVLQSLLEEITEGEVKALAVTDRAFGPYGYCRRADLMQRRGMYKSAFHLAKFALTQRQDNGALDVAKLYYICSVCLDALLSEDQKDINYYFTLHWWLRKLYLDVPDPRLRPQIEILRKLVDRRYMFRVRDDC